ncbi:PKD domain-containing protein [Candidatus Gracilibacteria bacterium]|nr:PKD domain-containing protein [Candidatus Gracilibacteria bacterium]
MTKLDLSEFDEIGVKPASPAEVEKNSVKTQISQNLNLPVKKPLQKDSVSPKKVALGCLIFFFALFALLIVAMIFGLRAGEETIMSFGLSPSSLKNWTVGIVSMLFGSLALAAVISIVYNLGQRILAPKGDFVKKAKAGMKGLVSGIIFVVLLSLWFFVYGYISRFEVKPPELPIEIITNPAYTYELTSPLQIEFSADRIINEFKQDYDIVSYEWDKEGDGKVDNFGPITAIYFPHGGKNNGVYEVILSVWLQPKGGGDMIMKEYSKTISISKQEIYGEIEVDRVSGDVPLTVKFNADEIADPHGSEITNYSWDLDADGRPDRDGFTYRKTEWTFDTIGTHTVTLTATSEDFNDDGTHEEKTFEKTITVHTPADSADADIWIEANPKKGFAPLTVNFTAEKKLGLSNSTSSRIDQYEWKIGDGLETLYGQRSKFTFKKPGNYAVELVVTFFNGQVKRDMIEIIVSDESIAPEAIIQTNPTISMQHKAVAGPIPLKVSFDAGESKDVDNNIVKYDWDFDGDGLWDEEGSLVSYEFWDEGSYKTALRITDSDGNESRAEVDILVGKELAVVNFGANKIAGTVPLMIDFDASSSRVPTGEQIVSYEWSFSADASEAFIHERAQISHIFETVGEHLVKLTLHTDDGSKYFDITKIVVADPSLNAQFFASRVSGNAPLGVSFNAEDSSGNISRFEWIFGDGGTSSEQSPSYIFENPGSYEVVLRVHDKLGNVSNASKMISVN